MGYCVVCSAVLYCICNFVIIYIIQYSIIYSQAFFWGCWTSFGPLPKSSTLGTQNPSAPGWARPLSLQKRSQTKRQALHVQRVRKWNSVSTWETRLPFTAPLSSQSSHVRDHWLSYSLLEFLRTRSPTVAHHILPHRLQSRGLIWGCSGEGALHTHPVIGSR